MSTKKRSTTARKSATGKDPKARAIDKTQTSISMRERVLELGKEMAEDDGRSFSNFIERLILEAGKQAGKTLPLLLIAAATFHLFHSPKDWSLKALASSGRSLVAFVTSKF